MYKITEKEKKKILKLADSKKTPFEISKSFPHITMYYIKKTIKEKNKKTVLKSKKKIISINYENDLFFQKIQNLKKENKTKDEILSICNITKILKKGYERNYLNKIIDLINEGFTKKQIEKKYPEVSRYYIQKIFSKTNMLKNILYNNSNKTMTLDEVGIELNLTRERIRQIQKEALTKLFLYFERKKMKFYDLI